jgi:hypothetical protein
LKSGFNIDIQINAMIAITVTRKSAVRLILQ